MTDGEHFWKITTGGADASSPNDLTKEERWHGSATKSNIQIDLTPAGRTVRFDQN